MQEQQEDDMAQAPRHRVRVSVLHYTNESSVAEGLTKANPPRISLRDEEDEECFPVATPWTYAMANPCTSLEIVENSLNELIKDVENECASLGGISTATNENNKRSPVGVVLTIDHTLTQSSNDGSLTIINNSGSDQEIQPGQILKKKELPDDYRPRPTRTSDFIVTVGPKGEEFYYSSEDWPFLSNFVDSDFVKRGNKGQVYVNFPNHSAEEWRSFVAFLQSYVVSASEISWDILPFVLPWSLQLRMLELLGDVDNFLLNASIECQNEKRDGKGKGLTSSNLLLLTNIAYRCGLQATKSQMRHSLRARLQEPREDVATENEEHDNILIQWSLGDLQLLSELLYKYEDMRDSLWESALIMYLPHDLNVTHSHELVGNPLFPYLLREGMLQLAVLSEEQIIVSEEQGCFRNGTLSPTSSSSSAQRLSVKKAEANQWKEILGDFLKTTLANLDSFDRVRPKMDD
jgi:hypothetical protein